MDVGFAAFTTAGLKVADTPVGNPETARLTLSAKLPRGSRFTV
jgi:hypothetical protein